MRREGHAPRDALSPPTPFDEARPGLGDSVYLIDPLCPYARRRRSRIPLLGSPARLPPGFQPALALYLAGARHQQLTSSFRLLFYLSSTDRTRVANLSELIDSFCWTNAGQHRQYSECEYCGWIRTTSLDDGLQLTIMSVLPSLDSDS